ncbi:MULTISPECIES: M14 family metallocarboxypeptidase [Psychromonas]|uniref:M14 family metallopeptidase n=1 Tax=Psychromonas TaxID=67572 RepID=UPI0003FEDFC7|nr:MULTISPECIES: M14 family metallocarboxypeptidase [Psychromonas]MBB1274860.1 M14 family metallocarboxypeptidase [Psychromonas sp. SR45-3]
MSQNTFYPIGQAGIAWSDTEKKQWLNACVKSRSYLQQVVTSLEQLSSEFDLVQYGALSINPSSYPLFALTNQQWDRNKPIILVTGGVHGYETSGVHGAIQFLQTATNEYSEHVNIVVLPCVSPWGYEHIIRWNPYAIDPNRSFTVNSPSEEASNAMRFVAGLEGEIILHIDLHETTDSDESEFRPALAARDGEDYIPGAIPDGFYLVGDAENKQTAFQAAIIKAVKQVTHIAPADDQGEIIGSIAEDEGVIYYPVKQLGLCGGMTNALYTTTTEVYPDSEKATDEDCNNAQVAAIKAALDFVLTANK